MIEILRYNVIEAALIVRICVLFPFKFPVQDGSHGKVDHALYPSSWVLL